MQARLFYCPGSPLASLSSEGRIALLGSLEVAGKQRPSVDRDFRSRRRSDGANNVLRIFAVQAKGGEIGNHFHDLGGEYLFPPGDASRAVVDAVAADSDEEG